MTKSEFMREAEKVGFNKEQAAFMAKNSVTVDQPAEGEGPAFEDLTFGEQADAKNNDLNKTPEEKKFAHARSTDQVINADDDQPEGEDPADYEEKHTAPIGG